LVCVLCALFSRSFLCAWFPSIFYTGPHFLLYTGIDFTAHPLKPHCSSSLTAVSFHSAPSKASLFFFTHSCPFSQWRPPHRQSPFPRSSRQRCRASLACLPEYVGHSLCCAFVPVGVMV
jgi:hypothetical protein